MSNRAAITIILAQLVVIALAIGGLIYALSRPAGVSFPLTPKKLPALSLSTPAPAAGECSTLLAYAHRSADRSQRGSIFATGVVPGAQVQSYLPAGSLLQGAGVFPTERISAGRGLCHGESNTARHSAHAAGREQFQPLASARA